jgi:hypothetical protein
MEEKEKDGLKITNQFRARGGMAYDLKCKGTRLTLLVSPRTTPDDEGEWRVEARSNRPQEEAVVVAEWGPTRIEALRAVGRSWTSNAPTELGMFDWEAVAQVLQTVRAL